MENPAEWHDDQGSVGEVFKCVWPAAAGVMAVFWATLAVFPGVVTRMQCMPYDPHDWGPVLLIATFNVGVSWQPACVLLAWLVGADPNINLNPAMPKPKP